ncbi:FISUMP domain-containing protein [Dysgonomonas sp. 25]|uniref:FISUMP domain-containing protein n=1 Tax=Dysgonomonas sp. 25 TaxID=2302933 RepID=UPI0013D77130|nr:FISUMP domain-containing protein [Dysgonomonas sp. 25]NDV69613.1 hypothetical protein [Dysgonomonas sp. 25]
MMKPLFKTTLLIVLAFISTNSFAQVTIGSEQPPAIGTLLDLKTESDGTSTKGLGMPRVKLIKRADADISLTIEGVAANEYTGDHTGLLVYNAVSPSEAICADIASGLYVWDGGQWQPLASGGVKVFTDPRDGEEYKYANFGSAGDWMIENLRATTYAQGGTPPLLSTWRKAGEPGGSFYKRYCYPVPDPLPNPLPDGATGATDGTDDTYFKLQRSMGLFYTQGAALNIVNYDETISPGEIVDNMFAAAEYEGGANELAVGYQGICPAGWHLPSDVEWNRLEQEIYNNPEKYSSYTSADLPFSPSAWDTNWNTSMSNDRGSSAAAGHAKAMMSQCETLYSTHSFVGKSKGVQQGGFNALPLGFYSAFSGIPYNYGGTVYFWTGIRDFGGGNARVIDSPYQVISRDAGVKPFEMLPVRCKKN